MGKNQKIPKENQQQYVDAADAKPPSAREEAAKEIEAERERSHGEREKQVASHFEVSSKDANTVGVVVGLPDQPRFPQPGLLSTDSDGSMGTPAEMVSPGTPEAEPVPTLGEPLGPPPSQPASAAWAEELSGARRGAQEFMDKITPPSAQHDPFAGFYRKAHRAGDTGQYAPIPGGAEVAEGHEVETYDEPTRPGSATALRGAPVPPRPNGPPPRPGETSVVVPSIRPVSPDDLKRAES